MQAAPLSLHRLGGAICNSAGAPLHRGTPRTALPHLFGLSIILAIEDMTGRGRGRVMWNVLYTLHSLSKRNTKVTPSLQFVSYESPIFFDGSQYFEE